MINEELRKELKGYIEENYIDLSPKQYFIKYGVFEDALLRPESVKESRHVSCSISMPELPELDESFSEMLLRKIDEKGMKDSECYNKALVDRRLFSKIRSDKFYSPSKKTAIALALALELEEDEFNDLLHKAGFSLSGSNLFDVIVKFFIEKQIYDIATIDEYLLDNDQETIGKY